MAATPAAHEAIHRRLYRTLASTRSLACWLVLFVACQQRDLAAQAADTTRSDSTRRTMLGVMATAVGTRASPAYNGRTFTELQLVQPVIMASANWHALSFVGALNAEGYTLRRGELNAGIFGEGYVDRRHPHTLVHEAMLSMRSPQLLSGRTHISASLAAGRGFVPYGSDDPMMRPLEKYPVNHHHSQILEREQVIAAARVARGNQSLAVEATTFNGDEPAGPFHGPKWNRFGDSWAVRTTAQPLPGVELSASTASVISPELQQGGAFDHLQRHASLRVDRAANRNSTIYLLAEWAQTDEKTRGKTAFQYQSLLIEGAYGWHGAQISSRIERTDRAEQARLADPFRAPVGHVDFQILGVTRWTVATVGIRAPALGLSAERFTSRFIPFVEVALARPAPRSRPTVFEPATFYGGNSLWSVSAGVQLHLGNMRSRMGRYGIMANTEHNQAMHHAM